MVISQLSNIFISAFPSWSLTEPATVEDGKRYLEQARLDLNKGEPTLKSAREHLHLAKAKFKAVLKDTPPSNALTVNEINNLISEVYWERGKVLELLGEFGKAEKSRCMAERYWPPEVIKRKRATLVSLKFLERSEEGPGLAELIAAERSLPGALNLRQVQSAMHFFKSDPPQVLSAQSCSSYVECDKITDTQHLARLLQQNSFEQPQKDSLHELAVETLEVFAKKDIKTLEYVREVVPLAIVADADLYHALIRIMVNELTSQRNVLLNLPVAQGLAVIIWYCPQSLLENGGVDTGDLVDLLRVFLERIEKAHKKKNTVKLQSLLQIVSHLLDVMVYIRLDGMQRETLYEPLDVVLTELSRYDTPSVAYQASYARQALSYIPNDEATWEMVLRHVLKVSEIAAHLSAGILSHGVAADQFYEAFKSSREEWESISRGLNRRAPWYLALRFADLLIDPKQNKLIEFERFARNNTHSKNENFLLGLCERLEQIERTQPDAQVQQSAREFLQSLSQDSDDQWGKSDRVKQSASEVLRRLVALGGASSLKLKRVLPVWDPIWQMSPNTKLLEEARLKLKEASLKQAQLAQLDRKLNPVAYLGTDIAKLEVAYSKILEENGEIRNALDMYVALECVGVTIDVNQAEQVKPLDLEKEVDKFLASDKKIFLLLGAAGSGKSTFNRYLARRLWREYSDSAADLSNNLPVPLFISLWEFTNPNEDLLTQYLKRQDFKSHQIDALRKHRCFTLILDGYDEIAQRQSSLEAHSRLSACQWKVHKIIVTSRPEYLSSDADDHRIQFQPVGRPDLFQECRLASFSEGMIEQYVDNYKKVHPESPWSSDEYNKALEQHDLKALVGNAFLLRLALEVLPTLGPSRGASQSRLTRIELYDKFVDNWLIRSQKRLGDIELKQAEQDAFESLKRESFSKRGVLFSKDVALEMYRDHNRAEIRYSTNDPDPDQPVWCEKYLGGKDVEMRLLRFNVPFICQGDQYKFIHKSIRDYFVARALWEDRAVSKEALFNKLNLVEKDPAVLDFLAEQVQARLEFKDKLFGWVYRSRNNTKNTDFQIAAANALTILVRAGVQFNGLKFNGIHVSGADLSHGVFDSTQFNKANLSKVNLRGAWLRGANFEEAELDGVNFGERPSLEGDKWVSDCCCSGDGRWLAIGTMDEGGDKRGGEIRLYKTDTLELLVHPLKANSQWVNSVKFSPDSTLLAAGCSDKTVKLWVMKDVEAKTSSSCIPHRTFVGHTDVVSSVSFSLDNECLASGSKDNSVKLWDVESGGCLDTLKGHSDWVKSVSFSPEDKNILASGSDDNTVRLWNTKIRKELGKCSHEGKVNSVTFSHNGKILASGSEDRTVRLWKVEKSGKELFTIKLLYKLEGHSKWVKSVNFSPNSEILVSGSNDQTVRLWRVKSGEALYTLEGHDSLVNSVAFSLPYGQFLASGSNDKTVRLWRVESKQELSALGGHRGQVNNVTFSPNGNILASGSNDKTVKLWNGENGKLSYTLEGHIGQVNCVAFSPNNNILASGSDDQTVKLWSVEEWPMLKEESRTRPRTLTGHEGPVWGVSFSADNEFLASGGNDKMVRLWRVASQQMLHVFSHDKWVSSVSFSPNGKFLASGGEDGTVKLWEVKLWEVKSGKTLHEEIPYKSLKHGKWVTSVSFSPNDKFLASGDEDNRVKLWNVESKQELQTLEGHSKERHSKWVKSVNFSPDSKLLALGGGNGAVKLWSIKGTGQCEEISNSTLTHCVGKIASIVWQEFSEGCIKMKMAGNKGSAVHIWQIECKDKDYKDWTVELGWTSSQNELIVTDMSIQGAQGLTEMDERLLKQKGAHGTPVPALSVPVDTR